MGATAAGTLARLLIATGTVAGGSTAVAQESLAGAETGAAVASYRSPALSVHYRGGHGYPPPVVYPRPQRAPVYVVPPPAIVFLPDRGHGYWHHGVDPWGRPLRTWVPAARPRDYYAPAPRPPHHHHRGYRDGWRHDYRW